MNLDNANKVISFEQGVLDEIECIGFNLRSLYKSYGFERYKMSKFEEYDLYVKNKDFLVSDSVITFTDTTGKLMALKPDVTLSIIKNTKDDNNVLKKICYNENVYRISKSTGSFKEIMQSGLECIGNVDSNTIGQVLLLALKSLEMVKPDFVVETASLDILSAFVNEVSTDPVVKNDILKCVSEKNTHGICQICRENNIPEENAKDLIKLVSLYGNPGEVLEKLEELCKGKNIDKYIAELKDSLDSVKDMGYKNRILIDFSVVSDLKYYNGLIFKGFIKGVPGSVLCGGQYDKLMSRMGRKSKAIGFAVYLDMLERIVD